MEIVLLVVGLLVGFLAAWFIQQFRAKSEQGGHEQQIRLLEQSQGELKTELTTERGKANELSRKLASSEADLKNMEVRLQEQREQLNELNNQLKTEFENIANKILDEKSQKFTELNKSNIKQILDPLGERVREFKSSVEETYVKGAKERSALEKHIEQLSKQSTQMMEDARNLTNALKGESKTQGNWGEIVLERVLEQSGLRKGVEYSIQQSFTNEEGRRLQPDVIVNLPDEKKVVVDSKVSLTAYERFCSAEDMDERERLMKAHIQSLRVHIKQLSEKRYQDLYQIKSPDFVLLFVPIEPAFSLAIQAEQELYNEALSRNIVIVSTSTLLATLKTIASIWKQEYQNQNVLQIADEAGKLYDKFVGFVSDVEDIGRRLSQTSQSYEAAMNKLSTGAGNLITRAEKMKELGAKAKKALPDEMIERAKASEQLAESKQQKEEEKPENANGNSGLFAD